MILDTNEKKSSSAFKTNEIFTKQKSSMRHMKLKRTSKNLIFKDKDINHSHKNVKLPNNYFYKKKGEKIINMKEYLSMSFDETDFYDVLDKDKRKFWTYFCEHFKMNQIFVNTFYIKEEFRPMNLKILVLIMTIELYFVINALFYNEDYLSDLYFSKEEEKFYSFLSRRFDEFIYTSAMSGVIAYFVSYVFIDDKKIKKIFIRNPDGNIKMKYELAVVVKNIGIKFNIIIIFSLCLTIICFIYISCFNNVYPYIKMEWIKSSITILLLNQIFNFLTTLIECILRYSSLKCNSEKIFRLSQVFAL